MPFDPVAHIQFSQVPDNPPVATGNGNQGYTLYAGRKFRKDSAAIECLGRGQSASASLGLARALARSKPSYSVSGMPLGPILRRLQEQVYIISAHAAGRTTPIQVDYEPTRAQLDSLLDVVHIPRKFVLPGTSEMEARLHVATADLRAFERSLVAVYYDTALHCLVPADLATANVMSDLVFVLASSQADDRASD